MPYEITKLETVHEGWSDFRLATVRTPSGEEIRREIEDHGDAVAVLPYDPERRVATLVRQFRTPVFHVTKETDHLESPAGILDADDPEAEVRREAEEEVGLRLSRLERLSTAWACPGVSTERIHLFLATYGEADRTGGGGGLASEHEEIAVIEMALAELAAMVDDGRLTDLKTLVLVQTLRLRYPELFA